MKWYSFIQKFFGLFFAAGMAAGFFFPEFFMPVNDWTLLILASVITLTFLTIDLKAAAANLRRFHNVAAAVVISKAVFPLILYRLALPLGADISMAVLLLGLTPFAGVSPTLTRIVGGDTEFIMLSQVIQTLFAPLYIPLLLLLYSGSSVELDVLRMMKTLVFLIIIPFGISLVARPFLKPVIQRTKQYYGAISILLITMLLTGLLAGIAEPVGAEPLTALKMGGWAFVLGVLMIAGAWFGFFFLDRRKRLGLAVGNVYPNIGMTAVIAAGFFGPEVILFVLIYELPANIFPALLGRIGFFRVGKGEK